MWVKARVAETEAGPTREADKRGRRLEAGVRMTTTPLVSRSLHSEVGSCGSTVNHVLGAVP
jgi:hypothetical protein